MLMNLHPTDTTHFHKGQRHLFFQYTLRYIRNNMISNTGDIPLLAGGYITLDTVKVSRRVDYGFMHCIIYSIRIAYTYLHHFAHIFHRIPALLAIDGLR